MEQQSTSSSEPLSPNQQALEKLKEFTRVTVLENIYFQLPLVQPEAIQSSYSFHIRTEDEALKKQIKVTSEWKPIPTYWVEQCCLLSISNDEGWFQVIPTVEEKQQLALKVVEVGLIDRDNEKITPFTRIRPQHSLRFEPLDIGILRLRSPFGTIKATINLIPGEHINE